MVTVKPSALIVEIVAPRATPVPKMGWPTNRPGLAAAKVIVALPLVFVAPVMAEVPTAPKL
jgi:hypothetical protein